MTGAMASIHEPARSAICRHSVQGSQAMVHHRGLRQLVVAAMFMIPCTAWAQSGRTGSIAGAVKDTTGAVMPGVTVEASSPALIEKVRTAVTDGNGEYKLVD